jgi:hypothetical protein
MDGQGLTCVKALTIAKPKRRERTSGVLVVKQEKCITEPIEVCFDEDRVVRLVGPSAIFAMSHAYTCARLS